MPDAIVGAGTVLNVDDVRRTQDAGGRLIVSPNTRPEVIQHAVQLGLEVIPGFATATEAFAAIDAGARRLKLFPAATYGTRYLQSLGAVLPTWIQVFPVGGVGARDEIQGVALVVAPGGRTLASFPLFTSQIDFTGGSVYERGTERRRVAELASSFAQWLPSQMGL